MTACLMVPVISYAKFCGLLILLFQGQLVVGLLACRGVLRGACLRSLCFAIRCSDGYFGRRGCCAAFSSCFAGSNLSGSAGRSGFGRAGFLSNGSAFVVGGAKFFATPGRAWRAALSSKLCSSQAAKEEQGHQCVFHIEKI